MTSWAGCCSTTDWCRRWSWSTYCPSRLTCCSTGGQILSYPTRRRDVFFFSAFTGSYLRCVARDFVCRRIMYTVSCVSLLDGLMWVFFLQLCVWFWGLAIKQRCMHCFQILTTNLLPHLELRWEERASMRSRAREFLRVWNTTVVALLTLKICWMSGTN